jgi:hypothetical protein
MPTFHLEPKPYSGVTAVFDDEPEPRKWLLSDFLDDADGEEGMYLDELAKAEAGTPDVVGNHWVWAIMSPDKVILEKMLYGDAQTDGTVPAQTEITLQEARQLILDYLEAKKRWYAKYDRENRLLH